MSPATVDALAAVMAADPDATAEERAQVLAVARGGEPVPRVYKAGEVAAMFGRTPRAVQLWAQAGVLIRAGGLGYTEESVRRLARGEVRVHVPRRASKRRRAGA